MSRPARHVRPPRPLTPAHLALARLLGAQAAREYLWGLQRAAEDSPKPALPDHGKRG